MATGGNKPYQRAMNRSHVLEALRRRPGASRRDLALDLGLDRSTITLIATELIEQGLVEETGTVPGASGRGRPMVGLRVRDERLCVLGVELHAHGFRAVVRDNAGSIHDHLEGSHALRGATPDDIATLLADVYRAASSPEPVVGMGCAIPGLVDTIYPAVGYSRELNMRDCILPQSVTVHNGNTLPVVFDNDARCGAWGELHARNGSATDLLFVSAQKQDSHFGVGLGIVAAGSVISGARHASGEFYSPDWQGDERSQFSLGHEELAAVGNDPQVTKRVLAEIVRGLVPSVSIIDPEAVVFGGFLREHFSDLLAVAKEIDSAARIIRLFEPARLGEDEITAGAAGMFHERLFDIPGFTASAAEHAVSWDAVTQILEAAS